MNFIGLLGKLGIDLKLLAAQLINFGLLMWILKKFLYKPIVNIIEKDEADLEEAKKQKGELVKEKESFISEQKNKRSESQAQVQKIIHEAELVAQTIKETARKEQEKIKDQIIGQTESMMKSARKEAEEDIANSVVLKTQNKILKNLSQMAGGGERSRFDEIFFERLISAIDDESFSDILPKLSSISDELEIFEALSGKNREATEQKLKELVGEKLGPVSLEYAAAVTKAEENRILDALEKKLGLSKSMMSLEKKKRPDLVSGFRLEVLGRVFEQNFLSIINYAKK